jgi:hypothetical protein
MKIGTFIGAESARDELMNNEELMAYAQDDFNE